MLLVSSLYRGFILLLDTDAITKRYIANSVHVPLPTSPVLTLHRSLEELDAATERTRARSAPPSPDPRRTATATATPSGRQGAPTRTRCSSGSFPPRGSRGRRRPLGQRGSSCGPTNDTAAVGAHREHVLGRRTRGRRNVTAQGREPRPRYFPSPGVRRPSHRARGPPTPPEGDGAAAAAPGPGGCAGRRRRRRRREEEERAGRAQLTAALRGPACRPPPAPGPPRATAPPPAPPPPLAAPPELRRTPPPTQRDPEPAAEAAAERARPAEREAAARLLFVRRRAARARTRPAKTRLPPAGLVRDAPSRRPRSGGGSGARRAAGGKCLRGRGERGERAVRPPRRPARERSGAGRRVRSGRRPGLPAPPSSPAAAAGGVSCGAWNMVGEMETKEKPKPTPDYLMQLMNDKKLMSSLPNFCGIFNHLERLLDEGESPCRPLAARAGAAAPLPGTRRPPECGEGGKVAAGGDRAPGDGEARAGREEAAPRLGSRGAAGGPRRRDAPPGRGAPAPGPLAPAGPRAAGAQAGALGEAAGPPAPGPASSTATAPSFAGLPGSSPASPAPRPAGA
ncbi:hypothetical protein J1605_020643 [Eschrichtius robustus]|uniref:STAR protein homodimerisation region domain-containing protein n=1 Tax=Eschrichtius robustus TaxID=9764 RepID=A0AB34HJB7_ESCRO|nr:hypothetical protein J1605_020643 [Eschrichtius robustus]